MQQVDVIVVGAGLGGSSAAYFLAKAGVQVVLLDRHTFPRDKTCGDGVTRRALGQLGRMGLDHWIESEGFQSPTGLRIGAPSGELAALEIPFDSERMHSIGRIIPRKKLDSALLEAAIAAGARFAPGVRATGMVAEDGRAIVHTTSGNRHQALRCQLAIAADGSKGSFSRSAGLQKGPLLCVAARTYLAGEDQSPGFVDMFYEPDIVPCYGWVFPAGDGVCNVGIGLPVGQGNPLRRLRAFIETNPHVRARLPQHEVAQPPRGAALYAHFRPACTYGERLLAVGDAAGLINPLTGSGISKALISGEIAALCAIEALSSGDCSATQLADYGRRLRARFGKRHSQLRVLRRLMSYGSVINRCVRLLNRDSAFYRLAQDALSNRVSPSDALLSPRILIRLLLGL